LITAGMVADVIADRVSDHKERDREINILLNKGK
jgi:hypothetical protein